jgi:hypothetical protein
MSQAYSSAAASSPNVSLRGARHFAHQTVLTAAGSGRPAMMCADLYIVLRKSRSVSLSVVCLRQSSNTWSLITSAIFVRSPLSVVGTVSRRAYSANAASTSFRYDPSPVSSSATATLYRSIAAKIGSEDAGAAGLSCLRILFEGRLSFRLTTFALMANAPKIFHRQRLQ